MLFFSSTKFSKYMRSCLDFATKRLKAVTCHTFLKYLRFENTCSFLQPVSLQWKKCREIRRYGVEFEQHRSLKMFTEFGQRSH